MDDYSSMPYAVTFGVYTSEEENKLNDYSNVKVIEKSVCILVVYLSLNLNYTFFSCLWLCIFLIFAF